MSKERAIQLYNSFTNIDDQFVPLMGEKFRHNHMSSLIKKSTAWVAAICLVMFLCGFAIVQLDMFDLWIQTPSQDPVEVVRAAIENQMKKEYAVNIQIHEIKEDESATRRAKQMYIGSDLAKDNQWSDTYLENNLLVVYASYYAEYDHTKTFIPDGEMCQYFFLLRDEKKGTWYIWDNTTNGDPFN